MNNAEYVKSLGLEFKDLTAKIEDYSEADKLYTWGILNKKTNKRIGSYHSFDKKRFSCSSSNHWRMALTRRHVCKRSF